MDLNAITTISRPRSRAEIEPFADGDAWLGGGTWLFSEPQPRVRRLIDLWACGWAPLRADDAGLFVAATCTVATLDAFEAPAAWTSAQLIGQCCRAFLASFKIWNMATVGGNVCLALPAGPMISLCAALDGVCVIWTPEDGERRLSIFDFVLGPQRNALWRGELLRGIELPHATHGVPAGLPDAARALRRPVDRRARRRRRIPSQCNGLDPAADTSLVRANSAEGSARRAHRRRNPAGPLL